MKALGKEHAYLLEWELDHDNRSDGPHRFTLSSTVLAKGKGSEGIGYLTGGWQKKRRQQEAGTDMKRKKKRKGKGRKIDLFWEEQGGEGEKERRSMRFPQAQGFLPSFLIRKDGVPIKYGVYLEKVKNGKDRPCDRGPRGCEKGRVAIKKTTELFPSSRYRR